MILEGKVRFLLNIAASNDLSSVLIWIRQDFRLFRKVWRIHNDLYNPILSSNLLTFIPVYQDPDLEAKRKAELDKIRSEKRKFKERIQETIQKKQQGMLKKKQMKSKHIQKKKAAKPT